MGFIDSYKHLEKLCGEVLNDDRRISAYIEEMQHTTNGSYYVRSWNEDLKNLKHYRWVRNQISHEPGCTEENMCDPEDALWIDEFYSRIMNQTDPLSQYHQATAPRPATKCVATHTQSAPTYNTDYKKSSGSNLGCAVLIILSLLIVIGGVLLTQLI